MGVAPPDAVAGDGHFGLPGRDRHHSRTRRRQEPVELGRDIATQPSRHDFCLHTGGSGWVSRRLSRGATVCQDHDGRLNLRLVRQSADHRSLLFGETNAVLGHDRQSSLGITWCCHSRPGGDHRGVGAADVGDGVGL
jgi:hypothetical protein